MMMILLSSADYRTMSGCCVVWIASGNTSLRMRSTFIYHNVLLLSDGVCAVSHARTKLDTSTFSVDFSLYCVGQWTEHLINSPPACIALVAVLTCSQTGYGPLCPLHHTADSLVFARRPHFSKFEGDGSTVYTDLNRSGIHKGIHKGFIL